MALQFEDLLQERPVEEIVELAACGQGTGFDPAMSFSGHGCQTKVFWGTTRAGQQVYFVVKPILQILL